MNILGNLTAEALYNYHVKYSTFYHVPTWALLPRGEQDHWVKLAQAATSSSKTELCFMDKATKQ